jgi:hypothetical protein
MADIAAQLDYAQASAWRRRKGIRRVVLITTGLVVLLLSLRWLAPAWDHARLLHFQGQCLAYHLPADRVVSGSADQDVCAPCWREFYALFSPPGRKVQGTVFLHEMRRPDGERRLVALEASNVNNGWHDRLGGRIAFEYHVFAPASPWRRATLLANAPLNLSIPYQDGAGVHLQVLAGQPDPADAAHFTLKVRNGPRSITFDGWLGPDDTLLLEPRDPS